MSGRWMPRAMDRETGPMDWATIGARILQAASMASAIHLGRRDQAAGDELLAGGTAVGKPVAGENARLPGCSPG